MIMEGEKNMLSRNNVKFYFALFVLLFLILMSSCTSSNDKNYSSKIEFENYADGFDISEIIIDFTDEQLIRDVISGFDNAYVYYNPKITDYSVVEKFGFKIDEYEEKNGKRYYRKTENGEIIESLIIDQFGCFSYGFPSRESLGGKEYPFSEKETMEMGKTFLKEYGLWPDNVSNVGRGTTTDIHDPQTDVTTIVKRGIRFFPKYENDVVGGGNTRIQVEFNANGELDSLIYNWREYESAAKAELISLDEAILRIKQGSAKLDHESEYIPNNIVIVSVKLSYWSICGNDSQTLMQPVYVFEGHSGDRSNDTTSYYFTVQANAINH